MIDYRIYDETQEGTEISDGFFEGWPNTPDKETHRNIMRSSYRTIIAVDIETDMIIGFVNILSDGVLSAYIPLLEVISSYRGKGIGKRLFDMAMDLTSDLYMTDLICDHDLTPFYKKAGMIEGHAMMRRNYGSQKGRKTKKNH